MLTGCVSLFQVNLRNFIEQIIGYKRDARTETDQRLPTNWSLLGFIGRKDSNRWWHLPKTKIGCFRMVKKFLSKQNATGYIRDKSATFKLTEQENTAWFGLCAGSNEERCRRLLAGPRFLGVLLLPGLVRVLELGLQTLRVGHDHGGRSHVHLGCGVRQHL